MSWPTTRGGGFVGIIASVAPPRYLGGYWLTEGLKPALRHRIARASIIAIMPDWESAHRSIIPKVANSGGLPHQTTLASAYLPQHFLNFLPLPQRHGSLRPTFGGAM